MSEAWPTGSHRMRKLHGGRAKEVTGASMAEIGKVGVSIDGRMVEKGRLLGTAI